MKTIIFTTFLMFFISSKILAVTNYVSLTGNHISPFANWIDAATNIQAAIDASLDDNIVLVNDGTYYPADQISITNSITLKSLNGAKKTIINGNHSHRCIYSDGVNVIIDDFIITNGVATGINSDTGGGIRGYPDRNIIIQNCIIIGNYANEGGGVANAYVKNCNIINNSAEYNGGGIYGVTASNCFISGNNSLSGGGGSAYSTIYNSIIINNNSEFGGGGTMNSSIYNSQIISNTAGQYGGGTYDSDLNNCLVTQNHAPLGGGVWDGRINNCTIVKNHGQSIGGIGYTAIIKNSVIYYNVTESDFPNYHSNCDIEYSCSTPLPVGTGNIDSTPEFVDLLFANYNLSQFSDCINAGTNAYVIGNKDLNGNPRIIDDIVDMGAYEYLPEPGCFWIIGLLGSWFIERKFKLYSSK